MKALLVMQRAARLARMYKNRVTVLVDAINPVNPKKTPAMLKVTNLSQIETIALLSTI